MDTVKFTINPTYANMRHTVCALAHFVHDEHTKVNGVVFLFSLIMAVGRWSRIVSNERENQWLQSSRYTFLEKQPGFEIYMQIQSEQRVKCMRICMRALRQICTR